MKIGILATALVAVLMSPLACGAPPPLPDIPSRAPNPPDAPGFISEVEFIVEVFDITGNWKAAAVQFVLTAIAADGKNGAVFHPDKNRLEITPHYFNRVVQARPYRYIVEITPGIVNVSLTLHYYGNHGDILQCHVRASGKEDVPMSRQISSRDGTKKSTEVACFWP